MEQPEEEQHSVTFLVVGGGIAGVSCAEMLAICCPTERTLLLTESSVIKTVANLEPVARYLYKFDVLERDASDSGGASLAPCILTIVDQLQSVETTARRVRTRANRLINYRFLCLCTGGRPHLIDSGNPRVLGIRDTDSVLTLQRRLQDARRLVLVGNGGIASELAHELRGVEVHWVVKDNHIASTFVDAGAAYFFQQQPPAEAAASQTPGAVKRLRYAELLPTHPEVVDGKKGAALGPDWHRNFKLSGSTVDANAIGAPAMHYKCQVQQLDDAPPPELGLLVTLSTGQRISCEFLVSATGVEPRHDFSIDQMLTLAADGGIAVNDMMATNVPHIYAAGDCCSAQWPPAEHWFQMRLWTQARQMGAMAGRSMAATLQGERIYQDFCFELFGHVTQLFGYQVVLLGRYNGQGLGTDYEVLLRTTPGREYVKFVLQRGRLRGAILIGNTELAETCENLILNAIDLTPFGDDILNPDIDIEDYFD